MTDPDAALLAAAATKLRELAYRARAEAPALTWEAEQVYDGVWTVDLGPATHPEANSWGVGEDCRMPRQMAELIAAMGPDVATPLADWLEVVSRDHPKVHNPYMGGFDHCGACSGASDWPCPPARPALATARAVLGAEVAG